MDSELNQAIKIVAIILDGKEIGNGCTEIKFGTFNDIIQFNQ